MTYSPEVRELAVKYKDARIPSNLAKWKHPTYLLLVQETSFLPSDAPIRQRLYHVCEGTCSVPLCKCGRKLNWVTTYKPPRYSSFCSVQCASKDPVVKQKIVTTNLEKYGVESFSKTEQHRSKARSSKGDEKWSVAGKKREMTVRQRHGVQFVGQIAAAKMRRSETNMIRYGHTNYLASANGVQDRVEKLGVSGYTAHPEFAAKRERTMLHRYGTAYYTPEAFGVKRAYTTQQRYGVVYAAQAHIPPDVLIKLNDGEWLRDQHIVRQKPSTVIAQELGVDKETVNNYFVKFGIVRTRFAVSYPERELSSFLSSHNIEHVVNDRKILNGKELDIVVPSLNIAIEYCGLYWHSTAVLSRSQNYHQDKLEMCRARGIRLITIFEDEWLHKRDIVQQKLLHILGVGNTTRVYARKCQIVDVDVPTKRAFLDRYHIQGSGPGSVTYGLLSDGMLVAVMTFIITSDACVLNRFATSVNVVGGFSKLLNHFIKQYPGRDVVSFADRRWSTGDVYSKCGFDLVEVQQPTYDYVDLRNIKRLHRFNFRHRALKRILGSTYDETLSELENTERVGWYRIYNCGLLKYRLNAQSTKNPA